MNIDVTEYRSSFNIGLLSNDGSFSHRLVTILAVESYRVRSFLNLDQVIAAAHEFAPHILLCSSESLMQPQNLVQLRHRFPETLIFSLGTPKDISLVLSHLPMFSGVVPEGQLSGKLFTVLFDKALENFLLKYKLEKLETSASGSVPQRSLISEKDQIIDLHSEGHSNDALEKLKKWTSTLYTIRHYEEAIKFFCSEVFEHLSCQNLIFYKYMPSYTSLVATHSEGLEFEKVRGSGLNFAEDKNFVPSRDFMRIDKNPSFVTLVKKNNQTSDFATHILIVNGEVKGLFLFTGIKQEHLESSYFQLADKILTHWISEILLIDKNHNLSRFDEMTGLLNKKNFMDYILLEVGRARRIMHPVCYMQLNIDHFENIKKELNPDRLHTLMKMISKVLQQSVRKTDYIGRLSANEIGVLFPHMSLENLRIKALKLKRTLETAKYFNDIKSEFTLQTSVCLSEYPSTAYDADDLYLTAGQKLMSENEMGQIYEIDKGPSFKPDFKART